ncbi:MAG TPA: pyridoxamine 5'-phosphate oxidase family protein [Woeseiaceae bacterium]|nr:pyridoxamine 5'-phosphate oxidase family protein [Woeseiaceae bacterium]
MTRDLKQTTKTAMSRHPERGSRDRALAFAILDEAMVAHVGVDTGDGVQVLPMTYARIDDCLFLHGAVASRWLGSFEGGREVCVCVTLLDGIVLARSAFSHSMNYRSVIAHGTATVVTDLARKQAAFRAFLDHLVPGRWEDTRQPNRKEVAATTVLALELDEASVKLRSGPPADAAADLDQPFWAGVLPLALTCATAVPDPAMAEAREVPAYLQNYRRPGR